MADPVIVPRAEHTISRKDIDPDALRVLYRLHESNYAAYLVGGGVRDLLLGRRPKDFDVGTSAHPYQIKKLFRNCWIIGRRFRLAHVRFGEKTIEVATFRKHIGADESPDDATLEGAAHGAPETSARAPAGAPLRHENTFGTPEEDAFRRDFTINALFYDIATFSVIDFVGGLRDLQEGVIRSIGDPVVRFEEDPVRMFRAVAFASRLDFALDPPIASAIRKQRHLISLASPARLVEEFYKILRSGAAERTFRLLASHQLLEPVTPELQARTGNAELWNALARLDAYRQRYQSAPPALTNPVLIGSLLVPLGLMPRRDADDAADADDHIGGDETTGEGAEESPVLSGRPRRGRWRAPKPPVLKIGALPVARRDTERLRQILALQRRLVDLESSPRARRALMHRGPFGESLTWLEIHGQAPEVLEHWRGFIEALQATGATAEPVAAGDDRAPVDRPRRRRRRGGRRRFRKEPGA
jgi:poly(A) polymerase